MRRTDVIYNIEFTLSFTAEEVEALAECSRRHYDYKCQAANKTGFINGLRNCLDDGVAEWNFNFRELDFAIKITEVAFYSNDPAHMALHYALKRQLSELAQKQRELNSGGGVQ